MFQQEEESERDEPVAADLAVVENETAVLEVINLYIIADPLMWDRYYNCIRIVF